MSSQLEQRVRRLEYLVAILLRQLAAAENQAGKTAQDLTRVRNQTGS